MSATAGASTPLVTRLKVVSFGDPGVGKSCLIKRYCEGKFVPKYIPTIGVDYGVKPVKISDRDVRVNFFDMSGMDAYVEIRNEFYKDASAGFIAFSVEDRESFAHIDNWLREAKSCGFPSVPLFLVGTKSDTRRAVSLDEAKRAAESKGMIYFETSSSTGQDVQLMFDSLFAKALESIPAS